MKNEAKKLAIITGCGGFLGSHLADRLLAEGYTIIGVDNFSTGSESNISFLTRKHGSERFLFTRQDVSQPWTWVQNFKAQLNKGLDYVFHFASPASPPLYQKLALETMWVNAQGTKFGMETCDQYGGRLIFSSTSEIYGDPQVSPQAETYWGNVNTTGVRSCYDESKRFGEALIHTTNLKKGTQHGIVRIFNTYGPRMNVDDGRVIINFLVQGLKGQGLTIYGDGKQTRSFCFVDDLIEGIYLFAKKGLVGPMNIGSDREISILEAAEITKTFFPEKNLKLVFEPLPQDDPKKRRPDLTLAFKVLDSWRPETTLEKGMRQMLSWLKEGSPC